MLFYGQNAGRSNFYGRISGYDMNNFRIYAVDIPDGDGVEDIQYISHDFHICKAGYTVRINFISGSVPGFRSGYPGWGRGGGYPVHISGRSGHHCCREKVVPWVPILSVNPFVLHSLTIK